MISGRSGADGRGRRHGGRSAWVSGDLGRRSPSSTAPSGSMRSAHGHESGATPGGRVGRAAGRAARCRRRGRAARGDGEVRPPAGGGAPDPVREGREVRAVRSRRGRAMDRRAPDRSAGAVVSSVLWADQLVDAPGDLGVSGRDGVLIAESRHRRGVAEPGHRFLDRRAGGGVERAGHVAQVVEGAGDVGVGASLAPDPPPHHLGRRVAGPLGGEQQVVSIVADELVEVGAQLVDEQLRQGEGAGPGDRLGVLEHRASGVGLDEGPFDGDGGWVAVEVEVSASEAEALALAEPGERGEQHHGPESRARWRRPGGRPRRGWGSGALGCARSPRL